MYEKTHKSSLTLHEMEVTTSERYLNQKDILIQALLGGGAAITLL